MRRIRIFLSFAVAAILIALAGAAAVILATLPPTHQSLRIPGLSAPVHVTLDGDGIPRIRADSEADGASALGFLHARDRLSQMTLLRAVGSGRLSELVGVRALPLDRMMRTLGLRRLAEADAAAAAPEVRALIEAYARGVNAWTGARGRLASLDAPLLGVPEPWTAADTMLWARILALWLSTNERAELSRVALSGQLEPARVLQLWPVLREALAADAPGAAERHAEGGAAPWHGQVDGGPGPAGEAARLLAALPGFPARFTQPAEESDEWAVDGRHSETGAPLLAGDPHLSLDFPCLWYLARIDVGSGATLAGATAPGTPFLVIGRNSRVAWTFTTASVDTQDLFEETVLPDGRYATPDGPAAFTVRDETIHVRGAADEVLHVRETRHGPVVSDLSAAARPGGAPGPVHAASPVLAAAMENLHAPSAAAGLLALNHARDVDEAGRAAPLLATPVQNLLVADATRIALYTTGRTPVRRAGDGAVPAPGADGSNDWVAEDSGVTLPHFVAPQGGRLLNGNEPTTPAPAVFLGRDTDGDWRARRIRARLDARPMGSVADFAAMQVDTTSAYAQALLPVLGRTDVAPGLARQAQALLAGWDGAMDAAGPQALVFNAWVQRFVADVLARHHIPEADRGPWEDFAAWLLAAPESDAGFWCEGSCAPLLAESLREASTGLAARFGPDPAAWRWGKAHQASFADPLLGALPLAGWLTTHRIAVSGDDTTLLRGGDGRLGGLQDRHGAGYRGVYDLADLDRSRFMIAPGQSGNPLSPLAWNMLQRWGEGATITLGPTPDRVGATVELTP